MSTPFPPRRGHDLVKNVLVVDSSENVATVRRLLDGAGWNIHLAGSSGEARYAISKHDVDFVITELILPRETGFELCSHLKKHEEHVPVLVFTEVDLQTARNLAIWSGADGFLAKPVGRTTLYERIVDVAATMHDRVQSALRGMQGTVEFKCGCGKSLKIDGSNAGRAAVCPRCGRLVRSPMTASGTGGIWKMFAEQRDQLSKKGESGFHCDACGKPVHLIQSGNREISCPHCNHGLKVPDWLKSHARLFFQKPEQAQPGGPEIVFEPLRYLVVRCEGCSTYYRFDPDEPDALGDCRHCGTPQKAPSLRGAPLSRAALTATGRFFEHSSGRIAGRKFLLPRHGAVVLGSGPSCHVPIPVNGVRPAHCELRFTDDGPVLKAIDPEGITMVGDEPVSEPRLLAIGDVLRLGEHTIRLLGNADLSENVLLESVVQRRRDARGTAVKGASDVADQAARVIQLHWERQRERWRAAGRPARLGRTGTASRDPIRDAAGRHAAGVEPAASPDPVATSTPTNFVSGTYASPSLDPTHPAYDPSRTESVSAPATGSAPAATSTVGSAAAESGRHRGTSSGASSSGSQPMPLKLPSPDEVRQVDLNQARKSARFAIPDDSTEVVDTAKDLLAKITKPKQS